MKIKHKDLKPANILIWGDQSPTLVSSVSMRSKSKDADMPQQTAAVAEVADGKQEWEIRDIIWKEVVNCEMHYLVEWSATLVPIYELGNAVTLVDSLRHDSEHNRGRGMGRDEGRYLIRKQAST
jgi:hypothetical protein